MTLYQQVTEIITLFKELGIDAEHPRLGWNSDAGWIYQYGDINKLEAVIGFNEADALLLYSSWFEDKFMELSSELWDFVVSRNKWELYITLNGALLAGVADLPNLEAIRIALRELVGENQ